MTRYKHLFTVAVAALAVMVFAPRAHAVTDCSSMTPGSGEAIQCRMGNLLSKNGDLISNLKTKFGNCDITDPRCAALKRHLDRATNSHNRAANAHNHTNSDNYNQLTLTGQYKRNSNRHGGGGSGTPPDTVDTSYDTSGATGATGQNI